MEMQGRELGRLLEGSPDLFNHLLGFLSAENVAAMLPVSKSFYANIVMYHGFFNHRFTSRYQNLAPIDYQWGRHLLYQQTLDRERFKKSEQKNITRTMRFLGAECFLVIIGIVACRSDDECDENFYFRFLTVFAALAALTGLQSLVMRVANQQRYNKAQRTNDYLLSEYYKTIKKKDAFESMQHRMSIIKQAIEDGDYKLLVENPNPSGYYR